MASRKPSAPVTPPPAEPPSTPVTDPVGEDETIASVPLYRNFKVVIPLFILVAILSVFLWQYYIQLRDFVSTDDAYIDGDRVSVSAKILGRVQTLTVDEGDTVTAGQVLVVLDDRDLRAQEAQAKSALVLASQNITLAKVNLEKAKGDYERAMTQFRQKVISAEQYDHMQSEYESARARNQIAVAQLAATRAQLGVIETQLLNTVIHAPMNGVVSKRWVLPGDVVQPGQPVFSVFNLQHVWVTANIEETSLTHLRLNDHVTITVDAYPDLKLTGTLTRLGANTASQFSLIPPNNASGNFTKVTQRVPIRIELDSTELRNAPHAALLPGMSVEVSVKVR